MLLRSSAGLGQMCIHDFFSVTAMYRISYSSCVALNKSVEVAQGLTTFFNLVYLGLKGGWETVENKNGRTIKAAGTCGPGWGTACLFGS